MKNLLMALCACFLMISVGFANEGQPPDMTETLEYFDDLTVDYGHAEVIDVCIDVPILSIALQECNVQMSDESIYIDYRFVWFEDHSSSIARNLSIDKNRTDSNQHLKRLSKKHFDFPEQYWLGDYLMCKAV